MFRMFPVNTSTNLNNPNNPNNVNARGRGVVRNNPIASNSLQYTRKVSSIFEIYNTKTYSCGSCGRG